MTAARAFFLAAFLEVKKYLAERLTLAILVRIL